MYIFRYRDGTGIWRDAPIEGEVAIGRTTENTFQIPDPSVAAHHAILHVGPDGCWIMDLGSATGTTVKGVRIPNNVRQPLEIGDEVAIGWFIFLVLQTAPAPRPATVFPPVPPPGGALAGFPAVPPPSAPRPSAPPASPGLGYAQTFASPPSSRPVTAKKRAPIVLLLGGAVILILVAAGIFALLSSSRPGANPADVTPTANPLALHESGSVTAKADGQPVFDGSNVGVTVPPDSLVDANGVRLVASLPDAAFDQFLKDNNLERKTAIYRLEVDGTGDSLPYMELSFPTSSPGDRLAEVVDGNGLIWADSQTVDGRLVVKGFVAAHLPDATSTITQPPQYVVLAPVTGSSAIPKFKGLASLLPALTRPNRFSIAPAKIQASVEDCTVSTGVGGSGGAGGVAAMVTYCRRLTKDHVTIFYKDASTSSSQWDQSAADAAIQKVAQMRRHYAQDVHLTQADGDNPGLPMVINVNSYLDGNNSESPLYNPLVGEFYFPWDVIKNLPTDPNMEYTVAHELAHWIEHCTYWMRTVYMGDTKWWIEIAAETSTFLYNPAFQFQNLRNYGQNSSGGAGHALGFQESAFAWGGAGDNSRYSHAQQFFSLLGKGDHCLMTIDDFKKAINEGTYPMSDQTARDIYLSFPDLIAQYLLNSKPDNSCNKDMLTGDILDTGREYGDYIHANQFRTRIDRKGVATATDNIAVDDNGRAVVNAPISPGGIYPLRVSNGADVPSTSPIFMQQAGIDQPSVPYVLKIPKGVSFYYKIGDGPVTFWQQEMSFGPITSERSVDIYTGNQLIKQENGIPSVRIVAVNASGAPINFQAMFEPFPPIIRYAPDPFTVKDTNTEVTLKINLERVVKNLSFTAQIDWGDGGPADTVAGVGGSDLKASLSAKHKFQNKNAKVITVSFLDKNRKLLQDWEILKIPVNFGQATTNNAPISQTTWLSIGINSGSNPLIGKGNQDVLVPIQWSDSSNFQSNPSINSYITVKGSVGPSGASVTINYPDISISDKVFCPHTVWLANIPGVAGYWQFSTQFLEPSVMDIGPYMSRLDTVNATNDQCFSGAPGGAPRSDSVFILTFCTQQKCP